MYMIYQNIVLPNRNIPLKIQPLSSNANYERDANANGQ